MDLITARGFRFASTLLPLLLGLPAPPASAVSAQPCDTFDSAHSAPLLSAEPDTKRVDSLLSRLSLEQKIGQLLLSYPPLDRTAPVMVGGVVMVGNLLKGADYVRERVADLQDRAVVPLLVAADVEGGELNRLSFLPDLRDLPSARQLGQGPVQQVGEWGCRVGSGMSSLGINLSLAPVLDLAASGMMYDSGRSFGDDPQWVANMAGAYSQGLAMAGVLAIGKHYPGYGDLSANTDYNLLVRNVSAADLEPEIRAFELAGPSLAGVMLSNVAYGAYGGEPAVIDHALVERAHYASWVTVTDDLAIAAIAQATGGDPAALLRAAYLAGNDLLLTTAPPDWDKGLDYMGVLMDLVNTDPQAMAALDDRVRRVLGLKDRLGLLEQVE